MHEDLRAMIESSRNWYVKHIGEPFDSSFRVVIAEGITNPRPETIKILDTEIKDTHAVRVTSESRIFELEWKNYVSYAVTNESYATQIPDETLVEGEVFRIYSKSRMLDFVSSATFACDDYPGPLIHVELICLRHIIDVVSTSLPEIRLLADPKRPAVH